MSTLTNFIDKTLQNSIAQHLLFWGILLLVSSYYLSLFDHSFSFYMVNNLALLPSQVAAAYLLAYFQVPNLIYERKYWQFALSFVVIAAVLVFIARILIVHVAEPILEIGNAKETLLEIISDPLYLLQVYFPSVYLNAFILLIIKLIKNRFEEKAATMHQLAILQKEKIASELKFLKTQIHPHFLFNTLNNLYVLTLRKSDAAPEVVVKLSEMLDYMLYQCNAPKISLDKEITLIQHYIDLEMLRYGERLDLGFKHEVDDPKTEVAPMILLSIVENAFKHGARGNIRNPEIKIHLRVKEKQLYYEVFNTKPILGKADIPTNRGIGANNIERQLELIYPGKHQIDIDESADFYRLVLKINL